MAATITTVSTSLEGQAFEIATKMQELELAVDADIRPNRVSITPNFEDKNVDVTLSIPFTFAQDTSGNIVISAATYLA